MNHFNKNPDAHCRLAREARCVEEHNKPKQRRIIKYIARIEAVDRDLMQEISLGEFDRLSKALAVARQAARERGWNDWDWCVEKYEDGQMINRRSSVAGFER